MKEYSNWSSSPADYLLEALKATLESSVNRILVFGLRQKNLGIGIFHARAVGRYSRLKH